MTTIPAPSQTPQLYEIQLPDIYALCDAWAIDTYGHLDMPRTDLLTFLSITAPITTVKAIRAHLTVRKEAGAAYITPYGNEIEPADDQRRTAHLRLLLDPQIWQARLPSLRRHHHLVLARRDPLPNESGENQIDTFYCFARSPAGGAASFYRQFTSRSPTPSIPQWAPQLWQYLLDSGGARPLETRGLSGWRCDINYAQFEEHICREVANHHLPVNIHAAG